MFHATEGWIEAKVAAVKHRLQALYEAELCDKALELQAAYDRRYGMFPAEERTVMTTASQVEPSLLEPDSAGLSASEPQSETLKPLTDPDAATETPSAPEERGETGDGFHRMEISPSAETAAAVARERVWLASRSLRSRATEHYFSIERIRDRIKALDSRRQRLEEPVAADPVALARIDDAYRDLVGAAQVFDREYWHVVDMMEQVTRRRAVRKWWKRLFRRLAGDSPDDLEAAVTVIGVQRPFDNGSAERSNGAAL
jgi:hypothetical protein